MADIWEQIGQATGSVTGRGIQIADLLKPTAIDVMTGNPHTLAEWFIFIILFPITIPLSFTIMAIRWLMVEAPFIRNQIMKMVGLERVVAIGSALERCAGGDNPIITPIAQALTNPSNEFDLGIMTEAASAVTSQGINMVLDPVMRPLGYCMERAMINNLLTPDQTARLVHKGLMNESYHHYTAQARGYNDDLSQQILNSSREPCGINDTLMLLNRGFIDEGTAHNWIRLAGLDEDIARPVENLRWFVPSVGEIQGFVAGLGYSDDRIGQFGLYDEYPTRANADLAKNGSNDEAGRHAWVSHWSAPNNGVLIDAMHRRIISTDETKAAMALNGVPPHFRDILIKQGVTLPMRRQINMMYKYGVIDTNYAFDIFLRYGFSSDDAQRLTQLVVKQVNPFEAGNLAGDATEAYIDDTIDYSTAKRYLIQSGHSEFEANLHLAGATHKKEVAVLKIVEQYAKTAYLNGDIGLDDAVNQCLQYGETAERANVLKELWSVENDHSIKHVSESDARNAYQIGLINSSQLRNFLEIQHYASEDIDVIIALENATMQKPQANVLAPITTSTGRAKSFTKAELKKMYIDGIITSDQWWTNMLTLGYTDAQVQAYAMLMLSSATTATGG